MMGGRKAPFVRSGKYISPMLTEYRHGALYVIRDRPDESLIQRELKKIDDRLFLEKQITYENEAVWCVVVNVGGDQAPITLLEWRGSDGKPIDLDSGIIERVSRMERDAAKLTKSTIARNSHMLEMRRKASREAWEDIAHDMIPRVYDRKRPVLHRSQALRMSRDRRRAQGEQV